MGNVPTTSGTAICSVVQSTGDGTTNSGTAAVSISTSGVSSDPLSSLFVAIKIIPRSKKDRKTNRIWDVFAAVHPSVKDYRPNSYVCLVCRGHNINSVVCLGRVSNISPSGLSSYMHSNLCQRWTPTNFLRSGMPSGLLRPLNHLQFHSIILSA